jgi:diphthamide synthase (EF-2-diphthine--ammonia ligase)
MSRPKALVAWSSGKGSAWALHEVQRAGEVEVIGLLTTITQEFVRVSMHAVREALLDQQAEALGLPCH